MPKKHRQHDKHFRGMGDQELARLAERSQRSGEAMQRRAGEAMRTAAFARTELARRQHSEGEEE